MECPLIREVWASNLESEFYFIRNIVDDYPFVAMDTEFPGLVARLNPVNFKNSAEYQYAALQTNVDKLKLIQLGLTFSDAKGNLPVVEGRDCVWQFNFRDFNLEKDPYALDSINLLRKCGIDFDGFREKGVEAIQFAELLISSGVVLNDKLLWITFHSCYDFGYLLKTITNKGLPSDEDSFFRLVHCYFPLEIDIKHLMSVSGNLRCGRFYGGLERLADMLGVPRVGPSHQAGSDSLLTSRVFFALLEQKIANFEDIMKHRGMVYGLGGVEEVDLPSVAPG